MDDFNRLYAMENFLGIEETRPVLERSFKVATILMCELTADIDMKNISLMELSSLAEDIHVKTRETSQNTDPDMREVLGFGKTLQTVQAKLANNATELTETDERIKQMAKS